MLCFAMASMPPRLGPSGITALTPALYRSWAQLFKRVYEADSLVCPACGGEMRIIAFIIDHDVVDAILRHLARAETQSPRGPPGTAAPASPNAAPPKHQSLRLRGHQALIFLVLVSAPPALMATFTASSIGSLKGTSIRSKPCA